MKKGQMIITGKQAFPLCLIAVLVTLSLSCSHYNDPSFFNRIQPVPVESGFKMNDYYVWGGSMIKAEGQYHLFAARWKKKNAFPADYFNDSEIVRAVADNPLGPFTFSEVVIGERDSIFWDSNMAHNPTIYQTEDGLFVLFYIGSDFTTYREDSTHLLRRVGYATAVSIDGPWQRSSKPIIEVESNNPAVLFEDDGFKLIYRDAPLRVFLAEAKNFGGPYTLVNDNVWPEHKIEDFYFFQVFDEYHVICEDNVGGISGHERWGVNLYSENGIDQWKKYDPVVVYDHELRFDDGTSLHCTRRERPQLSIQNGRITHLVTGIYDGTTSWCQPVALEPPIRIEHRFFGLF